MSNWIQAAVQQNINWFKSRKNDSWHHLKFNVWINSRVELKVIVVFNLVEGQLSSEWIYEFIVFPKIQTKNYKDFCPTKQTRIIAKKTAYTHQKITKKSATILVCLVGQKSL